MVAIRKDFLRKSCHIKIIIDLKKFKYFQAIVRQLQFNTKIYGPFDGFLINLLC